MIKLKPCPFCGGEAAIYDDMNEAYSVGAFGFCRKGVPTYFKCYCTKCGAVGPKKTIDKGCEENTWWQKEIRQQAIKAWNRRVNDEPLHP